MVSVEGWPRRVVQKKMQVILIGTLKSTRHLRSNTFKQDTPHEDKSIQLNQLKHQISHCRVVKGCIASFSFLWLTFRTHYDTYNLSNSKKTLEGYALTEVYFIEKGQGANMKLKKIKTSIYFKHFNTNLINDQSLLTCKTLTPNTLLYRLFLSSIAQCRYKINIRLHFVHNIAKIFKLLNRKYNSYVFFFFFQLQTNYTPLKLHELHELLECLKCIDVFQCTKKSTNLY